MNHPYYFASQPKDVLGNISLLFVDLILINISFYIAYLIRFDGVIDMNAFRPYIYLWLYISLVHITIFYLFKLYNHTFLRASRKEELFVNVLSSSVIGGLGAISLNYAMRHFSGFMPSLVFVLACLLNIVFVCGFRIFVIRQP